MSRLNIQIALRNIHIWVGLVVGILFCVMSLSGSLLIFRADIDKASRPRWTSTSRARPQSVLSDAVANVHQRWPDAKLVTITLPDNPDDPYEIEMQRTSRQRAFADSRSGEVFGTHSVPWLAWLVDLHHELLLGTKQAAGVVGILLLFTSVTGLTLWLIRGPNLVAALRLHWGASWKQLSFELHRATGLLANVLLLVVSLSGIYLGFPKTIQSALGVAPPSKPAKRMNASDRSAPQKPLEELMAAAQQALPGGSVRQIRLGDQLMFRFWAPGDPRPEGSNRVTVEADTAAIVQVDRAADWAPMTRFTQWIAPVHYAEWGGLTLRILWSFIGLIPPLLFVSGVMIWLRPYIARKKAPTPAPIPIEEFAS